MFSSMSFQKKSFKFHLTFSYHISSLKDFNYTLDNHKLLNLKIFFLSFKHKFCTKYLSANNFLNTMNYYTFTPARER